MTPQPSVTDTTHGHGSFSIQMDKLQLQRGHILKHQRKKRLVQSPKEPVVLQLIFTLNVTEHRTRVPDSKTDPQHELTKEDTSLIEKSPQGSGQSQQPWSKIPLKLAPRHRTHNPERDKSKQNWKEQRSNKVWYFLSRD